MQHKSGGAGAKRAVFAEASSPGGSADTFRAFLAYLDATAASWFVWENVDLARSVDAEASWGWALPSRIVWIYHCHHVSLLSTRVLGTLTIYRWPCLECRRPWALGD